MKRNWFNVVIILAMLLGAAPGTSWAGPGDPPPPEGGVGPQDVSAQEYWEQKAGTTSTQGAGTGDLNDIEILSMKVFNVTGADTLFAGTRDRGATPGGMVVRSQDGSTWTSVTAEGLGVAGAGDPTQEGVFALEEYNDFLYAATGCPTNGGCTPGVWRTQTGSAPGDWTKMAAQPGFDANIDIINDMLTYDPGSGARLWIAVGDENASAEAGQIWSSDGSGWTQETILGLDPWMSTFTALEVFQGDLWAAAGDNGTIYGAEIWRRNHTTGVWAKVAQDGLLGDGTTWRNDSARVMTVYKGALYVGTRNLTFGAQLFYTRDGINFVQVFNNGLDNPANRAVRDLVEVNGDLYLTMDSCTTLNCTAAASQARVYRSSDGLNWSPVSIPGFGDPTNAGATKMAILKAGAERYLYVGTVNFNAAAFGAQIWRTPTPEPEERWQQVVGPLPGVGNAGFDPAYDDAVGNHNFEATTFVIYNSVLYVGVNNDGPSPIPNGPAAGAQVYKTVDGIHWVRVGPPGLVAASGMTDVYDLEVFQSELYVAVAGGGTGRVYKLDLNVDASGNTWTKVGLDDLGTATNTAVTRLAVLGNNLYAGTAGAPARVHRLPAGSITWADTNVNWGNTELEVTSLYTFGGNVYAGTLSTNGADLWRTSGGAWAPITTDGFASLPETTNTAFEAMIDFNGFLYVGTRNTDNPDDGIPEVQEGGRIYRSADGSGGSFVEVSRRGFSRSAIATTTDPNNVAVTAFGVYNGYLYAGAEKVNCNLADPQCRDLGAEVWRTDGVTPDPNLSGRVKWEQVSTDGFSFYQNFRVSALIAHKGMLYAATLNQTPLKAAFFGFTRTGAEVWRTGIPNQSPTDSCAEVVYVAVSTLAPATMKIDGADARLLPRAGVYQIPLTKGPKSYSVTLDYADGSLFKDQVITVELLADGSVNITHQDPTSQGTQGTPQVNQYWVQRMTAGGGTPNNLIIESMTAFTPTAGTSALYAGGRTAGANGALIYRSTDGASWSSGAFPPGFGDVNNVAVYDLEVYNPGAGSRIYAAVEVNPAGAGAATYAELYESADGTAWSRVLPRISAPPGGSELESYEDLLNYSGSLWVAAANVTGGPTPGKVWAWDGSNWNDRTPPNMDAANVGFTSLAEFNGSLYAGTRNTVDGAQLWRRTGTTWTLVAQGGISNRNNTDISAMAVFKGLLYVGTTNGAGAELYASADGVNFTRIFERGLDNIANVRVWDLQSIDGYLFLGTQAAGGGRLYRSANGRLWSQVSQPGMGYATNVRLTAIYGYTKPGTAGRGLFLGTGNPAGAEIWETPLPPVQEDWERVVSNGWEWGYSRVDSTAIYSDTLYLGVPTGGGAAVYRSITGTQWARVGPFNLDDGLAFVNTNIESMAVHNGELYIGTRTNTGGGMVYKLDERLTATQKWVAVTDPVNRGFGAAQNVAVTSLYSFCSGGTCKLYAGTENASVSGAQLYEYVSGTDWNTRTPSSPFAADNVRIGAMADYNGNLFIGTRNLGAVSLSPGGEVWYSATPGNANSWAPATTDGFGNENNVEIRALQAFGAFLYAGTENSNLNNTKPRGGAVYRSATGTSGWDQVNKGGFEPATGQPEDTDNDAVMSLAVYHGYLYAGTRNLVDGSPNAKLPDGGEIWRTAGGTSLDQSGWTQVGVNGLGDPNGTEIRTMRGHAAAGYLFANTTDVGGFDTWRASLPPVFTGRFAQVVGAGVRVVSETVVTVSPGSVTYTVPSLGTYEIALAGQGAYNLAFTSGCGNRTINVDVPGGPTFDHLTIGAIASPQLRNQPFSLAIQAIGSDSNPIVITGTVTLTDTTGTLTPTVASFANQSAATIGVTIGITATNVTIGATFQSNTAVSNAFDVIELGNKVYLPLVMK